MAFTGKATYSAGSDLPELAEDVSDIIGIVSPYETPLLDHLGDPQRSATSTVHEWLEDSLLPNTDAINDATWTDPAADTDFDVDNGDRFRVGDLIQAAGSREVMLVSGVATNTLTVVRGYGGTTAEDLADDMVLHIMGNAALEGDDRPATRFTNRARRTNYTQILTAAVEVSGSQLAAQTLGLADELDYQKQERLRELVRDLENCVINGVAREAGGNPQGTSALRRTMNGIVPFIDQDATNVFASGQDGFPDGDTIDSTANYLNEEQINVALRQIWEQSAGRIDTLVVNGFQKRRVNSLISGPRAFGPHDERFRDLVSVYESDFGVCRVVMSRWVPADTALLVDSSRVDVLPLRGRSFHFKRLAATGDSDLGQIIGEYTLEVRNANAHGLIRGLSTS